MKLERAAPAGSEPNAIERMPGVQQDPGYFHVARYDADPGDDLGVGDTTYPVQVEFQVYGTADRGADYTLSAIAATGAGGAFETVNGPAFVGTNAAGNEVWTITIPIDQTGAYVKVNPVFDWKDEGLPGNKSDVQAPHTEADYGEYIAADMVRATWTGISPGHNPMGNPTSANPIVIHDGAILRVRVDSNNDGVLNADDDLPAVKNDPNQPGQVLLVNSDDDNLNDTEDKSERPPNFNVPSNGSAFLVNPPPGFSVTVDNEDDLARAKFYVWLDSLDPEDVAAPVEVDVYALAPSDLVMWSKPTKGVRIHRGSDGDGDGDGRIDVDTRLHTLTAGDTSWFAEVYVEANAPVTGTLALYADPVGSPASTGSDHAKMTAVAQGEWSVLRNQQPQAAATSSAGDTIVGLAKQIGLDAGEWQNWLKPSAANQIVTLEDGTELPFANLTVDTTLAAGQLFLIPNTIIMAWFGEMAGAGKLFMNWNENISDLGRLGFSVSVFDNDSYDPNSPAVASASFIQMIDSLSLGQLHGLYMMGHGSPTAIGSAGTNVYTAGPIWSVTYATIDSWTKYDLGAVIIHACYGNNSPAKSILVSGTGIYWGHSGVFNPFIDPYYSQIAAHWGYKLTNTGETTTQVFGGKQETHTFERTVIPPSGF